MLRKKKENDPWLERIQIMERQKKTMQKRKSFIEKGWDLQYRIEDWYKERRERKERNYREWLKNPTRRGKPIELPTMKELKRIRNRFLKITVVCWLIISMQTVFFLDTIIGSEKNESDEPYIPNPYVKPKRNWKLLIGNAIFISCGLIGFAHVFLAAGIDFAIYRRFGKENGFAMQSNREKTI